MREKSPVYLNTIGNHDRFFMGCFTRHFLAIRWRETDSPVETLDGTIQQLDRPQAIYSRPVNRYVAGFIGSPGMNFIDGEITPGAPPAFRSGELAVPLAGYESSPGSRLSGKAVLGVRPEHVTLAGPGTPFSQRVEIEIVEPMGSETLVWTRLGGAGFGFLVEAESRIGAGDRVTIGFDPARASLFDAAGGDRL